MYSSEAIEIQRDVKVLTIPEGIDEVLTKGEIVTLYQSLGGSYTVVTERGYMVRIAGTDADAIGKKPIVLDHLKEGYDKETIEHNCWEFMKTVYDPEIPINIVELGLVYDCQVSSQEEDKHHVDVAMTLTAPGCGMGPILQRDVEMGIRTIPGVESVKVEIVFEPPWSREMMSEAAQLQLGML